MQPIGCTLSIPTGCNLSSRSSIASWPSKRGRTWTPSLHCRSRSRGGLAMSDAHAHDRLGVTLIIGSILLFAVASTFLILAQEPPLRPGDLRMEGRPLTGHTLILLDRTDPFTPEQTLALL